MAGEIERAMKDLGIDLPEPAAPVANYVPCVIAGSLLYVSGQLPIHNGKLMFAGQVGADLFVSGRAVGLPGTTRCNGDRSAR